MVSWRIWAGRYGEEELKRGGLIVREPTLTILSGVR